MPVHISWDNEEQSILLLQFVTPWSWEEAYEMATQAYQMLEMVDHPVDTIIDWSQSTRLPINALSNARSLSRKRHPRSGITIACGANSALTAIWNIFARLYGVLGIEPRYQIVKTIQEARERLRQLQIKREGAFV